MSDDINIRSDWFVGLIRVSHPQAPGLGAMVDQIFSAFPK